MKKNVFISNVFTESGIATAKAFRASGYYVYGADKKEDYEGLCDRSLRFDLNLFVTDAGYRIKFTQIFDEIMLNLNTLVFCQNPTSVAPLKEIQLEYWNASINEEVTGPMLLAKLFQMRLEKSQGSIVFILESQASKVKEIDIAYITSSSALIGLMRAMSLDMAGKVKVNAITTASEFKPEDKFKEPYMKEVAQMAVHLSDQNKVAINGTAIAMEGGLKISWGFYEVFYFLSQKYWCVSYCIKINFKVLFSKSVILWFTGLI